MHNETNQFRANISRAREMVGIAEALAKLTQNQIDISDMYRAALVQAVAALDTYIHSIVLEKAVRILLGDDPPTPSSKFSLSLETIQKLINADSALERELGARETVAHRLHHETFQSADSIASALSTVGVPGVWKKSFGIHAEGARRELSLVVSRRNAIVHRCDVSPADPSQVAEIDADDATRSIEVIERTFTGIDAMLNDTQLVAQRPTESQSVTSEP